VRTRSCVVSSDGRLVWAQHAVKILCVERFASIVVFRVLLVFSWRKTTLFIISTIKEVDVVIRTCCFTLRQRQGHVGSLNTVPKVSYLQPSLLQVAI